jgi:hypothetical protein
LNVLVLITTVNAPSTSRREKTMPVKVVKRNNKFRVVEASTGKIAKRGGSAVDGGGQKK